MIDAHCHIDAYADPYQTALMVDRARVLTIAVTNLPTDFARAYPHVRPLRYIRLALGLHPLLASAHVGQRDAFRTYLGRTSYVGEVGLDFSSEGQATRVEQIESFRFVLQLLRAHPKFVSVHSRRAESAVLDLVEQMPVGPVVFHWFGGSLSHLERLLSLGHYCSINPAMLRSTRGRAIVERVPRDRVLTETDGPFVQVRGCPATPLDVGAVERSLARHWDVSLAEVRQQVQFNLRAVIPSARAVSSGKETQLAPYVRDV